MIKYVEMKCDLNEIALENVNLPAVLSIRPTSEISQERLYKCYYEAFEKGDAKFFFSQDEEEKRDYFNTLGFDEIENDPTSFSILSKDTLVGFSVVLKRGADTNRQISCMSIHPKYQGKGYGKLMLHLIMEKVAAQGATSITLGTEPEMRAFELYESNGFQVFAEHVIE